MVTIKLSYWHGQENETGKSTIDLFEMNLLGIRTSISCLLNSVILWSVFDNYQILNGWTRTMHVLQ